MHGIVLQEMGQCLGIREIVDSDDIDVGTTRLLGTAKNVPADPAEPVDSYPDCHGGTPDISIGDKVDIRRKR
jgi:hypothetical protein